MKKYAVLFALVSVCCFAEPIDKILAVVNGEIVTKSDLSSFKKRAKGETLVDDLFELDYKRVLKDPNKLLSHLIDQKIVDSEVRRLSLGASEQRVDAEIAQIAKGLGIKIRGLKKRLKQDSIAFEDYRDFIRTRIERRSLIQKEITSKIRISDDEVKSYYTKFSSNSASDLFEYSLSNILIKIKDSESDALTRAKMVKQKIDSGLNFTDAASQFTEETNYSSGGFLGTFKSGEFLPAFEQAVKSIEEGKTTDPIKVGKNYILLKLNKKQITENPEFLKVKEGIRGKLQELAFKKQFQFWLSQKKQESNIKIN